MKPALARATLALAAACMAKKDQDWAQAMQAELEKAIDAGKPLRFAFGCLFASFQRMPTHDEGRFTLTSHGFAIGLMLPVAALQLGGALSGISRFLSIGNLAAAGSLQAFFLASAYRVAIPLLAILTFSSGSGSYGWRGRCWIATGRALKPRLLSRSQRRLPASSYLNCWTSEWRKRCARAASL